MTMKPAKVVGEVVKGFITLELHPDRPKSGSMDESSSTMVDNLEKDLVPEELREPGTNIWLATEKTTTVTKGYVQKVFLRESEEYPKEYYDWLQEIGVSD